MKRFALALLILMTSIVGFASPTSAAPRNATKHTYPANVDWNYYFDGCYLSDGTDYCTFMVNWLEENGGMPVFGLPIGVLQLTDYGMAMQFERFRVEYHRNEPQDSPYTMQLGIMGEERLIQLGRIWQNEPRAQPQPGCRYFAETGHNLCGNFQKYWTSHGREFYQRGITYEESLSLFGFPITEAVPEVGSDGVTRVTQWFQRARMEDHGADGILLGLLNAEIVRASGPSAPTLAPPSVSPPPAPPPAPNPPSEPPSGRRIGAICRDGTRSSATGRGACSHHGGVREWIYG